MKIYALNILTLSLCAASLYLLQAPHKWYAVAAIVAAHLIFLFFAVKNVQLRFFVPYHNKTQDGVLLTFDDGPVPEKTLKVAQILNEHGVKGMFFLIGENVEKHPEIVQDLIKMGHAIGNHSFSHTRKFSILSTNEVEEEIRKGHESIAPFAQNRVIPFRVPYGLTNPRIGRAVRKTNELNIGWNHRTFDTVRSADDVLKRLKRKLSPNDIVLLHDHSDFSFHKMDAFLQWASGQNIKFADPHAFIESIHP